VTALRVATRGSQQALTQARAVAAALAAAHVGLQVELVTIETTGDRRTDVPLHSIGGQGVFVKEVQQAVIDGRADLAVHSAKDLPSIPTIGLRVGAWCARRDPRDVLVGSTLAGLAEGATVASGSVRRRAQLAVLRPDLHFVELRGNIATRLTKVPDGGAIVMAAAALEILGMTDRIAEVLEPDVMVPAVGQGVVAVEHRDDDPTAASLVRAIDHGPSRHAVEVERAFLAELGSGCSLPVGGFCDGATLRVFLAGEHTIARRTIDVTGSPTDVLAAASLARELHAEVAG
jgi:hydroxymethylbilane synthase